MTVVVTPRVSAPALAAFDVARETETPADAVAAWRDVDADAVVVDGDRDAVAAIREAPSGDEAPVVFVTSATRPAVAADAILAPDAPAATARDAVSSARAARDYHRAVTELYEACAGRSAGRPEKSVRRLRYLADLAYEDVGERPPPSAFQPEPEQ